MLTPSSRRIPTDLRQFHSRDTQVELTAGLSFQVLEVLFQARPSHWSRIWPSAIALSRWLLEQSPETLPVSARELGCGLGLVSMTLAHLGVRAEGTDRNVTALAFAARNAERNCLAGFSVSHLDWSVPEGAPTSFLVASDVLYERDTPGRLFDLLHDAGLLLPTGRLLLGGPQARIGPLDELVARLREVGYSDQAETRRVEWDGRAEEIDIHLLARPSDAGPSTPPQPGPDRG